MSSIHIGRTRRYQQVLIDAVRNAKCKKDINFDEIERDTLIACEFDEKEAMHDVRYVKAKLSQFWVRGLFSFLMLYV